MPTNTEHQTLGGWFNETVSRALDHFGLGNVQAAGQLGGGILGGYGGYGVCFAGTAVLTKNGVMSLQAGAICTSLGAGVGAKIGGDIGWAIDEMLGRDTGSDTHVDMSGRNNPVGLSWSQIKEEGGTDTFFFSMKNGRSVASTIDKTGCVIKTFTGSNSAERDYGEGCETTDVANMRAGDDIFYGMGGRDRLDGGSGNDTPRGSRNRVRRELHHLEKLRLGRGGPARRRMGRSEDLLRG